MGSGRISSGQNSVLYLRGVTYTDLEAVLNFMYHGEANVAQVFVASRISNRVLEYLQCRSIHIGHTLIMFYKERL